MRALVPLALLVAAPASAQYPAQSPAQPVAPAAAPAAVLTVELSNFRFSPATLILKQGETYRIRFVNTASGGHDFVAKEFFAASQVALADQAKLHDGEIGLHGHETVAIEITPRRPGTFRSHCSHFMHSSFGMKGEIVVEPAAR